LNALLDSRPRLDALPPVGDARPSLRRDHLGARQHLDATSMRLTFQCAISSEL